MSRAQKSNAEGPPESHPPDFGDVSGVVLAHLLAPVLADLSGVPVGREGEAQLVDAATALVRLESWAVAARARVLSELRARTLADVRAAGHSHHRDSHGTGAAASHGFDDQRFADRIVATDLVLAAGLTPYAADRELDLAQTTARNPNLGRALASGRLDRRRVELIARETAALPLADPGERDPAAEVMRSLVGPVGDHSSDHPLRRAGLVKELTRPTTTLLGLPTATLARALRREIARVDPEAFARRAQQAARRRHVAARALPDAMAELSLVAPGPLVAIAHHRVTDAARQLLPRLRALGDDRALNELAADIVLGQLTGGDYGTAIQYDSGPRAHPQVDSPSARSGRDVGEIGDVIAGQAEVGAQVVHRATLPDPVKAAIVVTMPHHVVDPLRRDHARSGADRPDVIAPDAGPDAIGPDPIGPDAIGPDAIGPDLAELHGLPGGPVPIPGEWARSLAFNRDLAVWLGLTHDRQGHTVATSPTYRPPPAMTIFTRLRDGLGSRLPGPATCRRLETDHLTAWAADAFTRRLLPGSARPAHAGGTTRVGNLLSVDPRGHHLKTDRALTLDGHANGPVTITTHTGHQYTSWPECWEPAPEFVDLGRGVPAMAMSGVDDPPPF